MSAVVRFARLASLAALLFLTAASAAPRSLEWSPPAWVLLVGGFFARATFSSWKVVEVTTSVPGGLYLGLTLGIILGAAVDFSARGVDHNLLPLELVFFWAAVGPSTGFGLAAGRWLRRRRIPIRSW